MPQAANLDPERIKPLVVALPGLWLQLRQDLDRYARFLTDLAQA